MGLIIVTAVLLFTMVLLITEWIPVDLTALGIMAVLMVTGILTPAESLAGLSNPAPVTVALLFIVSKGLLRSGALDFITAQVIRLSAGSPNRLLLLSLALVGGFSSFLNNTPVVVLFISIIMAVCCEYSLSPAKFLMPISFISILAGTSTLIGTSTNILVSDLAAQSGLDPIGMFELSLIGMPMAMTGAVYLYFMSPRLLGSHKEPVCEIRTGERHRYISELRIPEGSPLVGQRANEAFNRRFEGIELYQIFRQLRLLDPDRDEVWIEAGDVLLVKATAHQLAQILDEKCARLAHRENPEATRPHDPKALILELLVKPNSVVVGRSLAGVLKEMDAHIQIIGVTRHWKHYPARKVRDLRLAVGDILLAQVPLDHLDQLRAAGDLLVIESVHQTIINKKKAPLAMAIFLAMILVASTGVTSILVAAMVAMLLMLATRCLNLQEAYRAIDARVLVLIIGTLALGTALTRTGAADLYATWLLRLLAGQSHLVMLSAFIMLTSLLSLFISNNTTAVVLLPVALSAAANLGVDPRPFVMGIVFGASACYATPIGYQTNLLVYGPGGYRFKDYLKLGLPLNLWVWLVSSILIPVVWPF